MLQIMNNCGVHIVVKHSHISIEQSYLQPDEKAV
jgi:hypothetical protein